MVLLEFPDSLISLVILKEIKVSLLIGSGLTLLGLIDLRDTNVNFCLLFNHKSKLRISEPKTIRVHFSSTPLHSLPNGIELVQILRNPTELSTDPGRPGSVLLPVGVSKSLNDDHFRELLDEILIFDKVNTLRIIHVFLGKFLSEIFVFVQFVRILGKWSGPIRVISPVVLESKELKIVSLYVL